MSESKSQPSPSDDAPSSQGSSGHAQDERAASLDVSSPAGSTAATHDSGTPLATEVNANAGSAASGIPFDDRPIEDLGEEAGEVTSGIRGGPPNSAFTLTEQASASEGHLAPRAGALPDPSPATKALGASGAAADLPTLSTKAVDPVGHDKEWTSPDEMYQDEVPRGALAEESEPEFGSEPGCEPELATDDYANDVTLSLNAAISELENVLTGHTNMPQALAAIAGAALTADEPEGEPDRSKQYSIPLLDEVVVVGAANHDNATVPIEGSSEEAYTGLIDHGPEFEALRASAGQYRPIFERLASEIEIIVQAGVDDAVKAAARSIRRRVNEHIEIVLPEILDELARKNRSDEP